MAGFAIDDYDFRPCPFANAVANVRGDTLDYFLEFYSIHCDSHTCIVQFIEILCCIPSVPARDISVLMLASHSGLYSLAHSDSLVAHETFRCLPPSLLSPRRQTHFRALCRAHAHTHNTLNLNCFPSYLFDGIRPLTFNTKGFFPGRPSPCRFAL